MFWGTPTPNLWLGEWVDLYVSRVGWVDIRKVGTASETVSRFKISRAWQWQLTSNSCPTACLTAKMSMAGVRGRKAWKGKRKYTSLSYSLGLSQSGIRGQKEVLIAGIPYPLSPILLSFSLSPSPLSLSTPVTQATSLHPIQTCFSVTCPGAHKNHSIPFFCPSCLVYRLWMSDNGGSIVNIIADMRKGFPGMA